MNAHKLGMTKEECIVALQEYDDAIQALLNLFDDKGNLMPGNRERAEAMLRDLKAALKEDYKRRDTIVGRGAMSAVEDAFFQPAIQGANAYLSVKVNSRPSAAWLEDLYYIRVDIARNLHQLKTGK